VNRFTAWSKERRVERG